MLILNQDEKVLFQGASNTNTLIMSKPGQLVLTDRRLIFEPKLGGEQIVILLDEIKTVRSGFTMGLLHPIPHPVIVIRLFPKVNLGTVKFTQYTFTVSLFKQKEWINAIKSVLPKESQETQKALDERPFYKKKRFIIPMAFLALGMLSPKNTDRTNTISSVNNTTGITMTQTPTPTSVKVDEASKKQVNILNQFIKAKSPSGQKEMTEKSLNFMNKLKTANVQAINVDMREVLKSPNRFLETVINIRGRVMLIEEQPMLGIDVYSIIIEDETSVYHVVGFGSNKVLKDDIIEVKVLPLANTNIAINDYQVPSFIGYHVK